MNNGFILWEAVKLSYQKNKMKLTWIDLLKFKRGVHQLYNIGINIKGSLTVCGLLSYNLVAVHFFNNVEFFVVHVSCF